MIGNTAQYDNVAHFPHIIQERSILNICLKDDDG